MQVGDTIYLDYQASTPVDERVLKVMNAASTALFANPHSADHVLGWRAGAAIEAAAHQVANLFGLQGDDVIFTSGASESNAMAIHTAVEVGRASQRTELLIGVADHGSILTEAKICPLDVRKIPVDNRGAPNSRCLDGMITDVTALVSIIGVNNENGAIADLKDIATICRKKGVLLHVDLAQAPLAMDIDLLELEVDFATISAHKLYGPKGIGALLTGPGVSDLVKPVIVGAGQQAGRRGGTMPTELIVGFGEACELVKDSGLAERARVSAIRDRFVKILQEKQIASLIGSQECRHPGNALLRFPGQNASELLGRLQPQIAASTQSACASGSIEPSHVLQAMGYDKMIAAECIRFSFGRYSTIEQADAAVAVLENAFEAA
ncbi:cysteine desulfurase family protein [Roseibium salinum]|uniref:Cysteine desulfurase n=1 Tax=Roseibium salinum TaxID=1604349 RepID=A0ABT3R5I9_9HYPH|nr:cysteine desulfurase family protein [Roseibium sp. DSM 29163]MCX2724503.1 cysteine desulfurase family protein [Roseibium sp. DSM 29163]